LCLFLVIAVLLTGSKAIHQAGPLHRGRITLSIAAAAADRLEGNSGTTAFTFTVTRGTSSAGTSSVTWSVEHVGTNAADFSGPLTGSVVFAPGETTKTISISVIGDTTVELDEAFNVRLSAPVNATLTTAVATGVIRGDDSTTAGVFSAGNDTVTLTTSNGVWFALGGDDRVTGTAAADTIYGGEGTDTIDGGAGDDTIDGGAGNDTIIGGAGADRLFGGDGNDYVWFDAQDTLLSGGAGYDYLIAADQGAHTLVLGSAGFETIIGGAGTDTFDLTGATSDQLLIVWGGGGADRITMGASTGYAYGGEGDDILIGGDAIDVLIGGEGADTLLGGAGNDVLWIDGRDTIDGGAGIDWAIIFSSTGDTIVVRDAMNVEVVAGNSGNDVIDARATTRGHHLHGNAGDDVIYTGSGNDNLYSGAGADTFVFSGRWGLDQIWDWQSGIDKISFAGSGITASQLKITSSGSTAIVTHISTGDQIYVASAAGKITTADMIF
jgi:serralysin